MHTYVVLISMHERAHFTEHCTIFKFRREVCGEMLCMVDGQQLIMVRLTS